MTSFALRGGSVVDGSGRPPRRADVLVRGGRIEAVGDVDAGDLEVVDAGGLVVAPGFIDFHTHYDAQVFWDSTLSSSCWHGVTTVVGGNCGYSVAPTSPDRHEMVIGLLNDIEDMSLDTLRAGMSWGFESFADYLDAVDRRRPYLNWAGYVGHSALRIAVMGYAAYDGSATPDQVEQMVGLARAALDAGAIGVATTTAPAGRNPPSRYASRHEVLALLRCLAEAGHGVAAFVPGGDLDLPSLYELQPEIGRPFTWTALLASDGGQHLERVAIHREGLKTSAAVHPQVSCRKLVAQATLANGFALRCPAMVELDRVTVSERLAAFMDPAWRRRVAVEIAIKTYATWDRWSVAESERHPELRQVGVLDAARAWGTDPLNFVLDISLEEELTTRFQLEITNRDEDEVRKLLHLEGAVLGLSDAGAHPDQLCDAVLPTDLLGGWVRDRQALTLEHAVRKLTGELADVLQLPVRGYVRPGYHADLVVFDPATVGPGPLRRVRDLPAGGERIIADAPSGIAHVFVNGTAITRDGRSLAGSLDRGPGAVLRSRKVCG